MTKPVQGGIGRFGAVARSIGFVLLAATGAFATSYTWQGASGGSWATTTNWNPNGTPGSGDDIVVDKAGGANINLNGARSVQNITLGNSSANSMTIQNTGGGGLTLYGDISSVAGSTGAHVISCPIVLANNLSVTMSNTTGSLDIQGAVSGAYSITKVGTGKLTVSGATTNTGPIYSDLGTLTLSGSHTWSTAANDNLEVNTVGAQNAMLKVTGGTSGVYYYRIARGTNAIGAVYQSGGALTVKGTATGTEEFSLGYGGGSYGYYLLSGGSLTTGEANIAGVWGGDGIMDVTGGTLTDNGFLIVGRGGTSSGLLNIRGGTVTTTGASSLNWATNAGDFSVLNIGGGAGAASLTGQGTASTGTSELVGKGISLTGTTTANTGGGLNLLNNGTMTVSEVTAYSATPISILNFNGGTLKATSTNTGANFLVSSNIGKVYVHSGGAIIDDNGTAITISRPLLTSSGTGVTSVNVTAAGSGYFGAPLVSISGGTGTPATVYANMIDDGTGNGTYKVSSVTVTTPGVYTVAPTTVTFSGGGPTSAATATLSTGANVTTGGLTKNGSGTLTLSAASTYSGSTTINSGELNLSNNSAVGTGTVVLNGGTLASTGTVNLANAVQAPTGTSSIIDVHSGGNLTLNGNLTGSGTITRGADQNQTLFLGGDNSGFTGTYQDQNDALSITRWSAATGGSASARWIFNQAQDYIRTTLDFGTGTIQFGSMSGAGFLTANSSGTKTIQVGALGLDEDYSGRLQESSGALALTKVGSGTFTLSGANAHTGATTVSAGTLQLNNTAALGTTAAGTSVTSGASLDLNGVNYASAEALTLNGTGVASGGALMNSGGAGTYAGLITLGSASSIVGGAGTINVSNAGTITGSGYGLILGGAQGGTLASIVGTGTGTLTKQDAGTWTLSGANTFSGTTSVNAGTLLVNGSDASSAVTVASGAILGGTGTVAGVTASGAIRPGSAGSKGIFTAASANLSGGALSIRGAAITTAGTTYDRFKTTGALTLGGTSVLNLDLSGFSGTGTLTGVVQAGSIAGTFATVNISNYAGSASVQIAYNTTSIDIVVGSGTTFSWTGNAGTTDWGTPTNWSPIGIPGADALVTINKAGGATVALNGNRSALSLTLGNASGSDAMAVQTGTSGVLTIASGGILTSPAGSTGSHVISCPVALTSNFGVSLFGTGETVDIQGVVSGAFNLTKNGSGTLKLSGANAYSGTTSVSVGILQLGSTGALGSTSGVTVSSGAVLDLAGQNYATSIPLALNGTGISSGGALINSSATGATYAGLITLGSASSIVGGTGTITVGNAGTITGSGNGLTLGGAQGGTLTSILGTVAGTLTKQDAGTWTLSGANTFTGLTTVSAGTLKLNNTAALGTTANGTSVTSGAVLDLNGLNYASAEALTLNGTGISNGGALINSSATGATYGGLITLGSASSIIGETGTIAVSNAGTISGSGFGLTLGGALGGTLTSILGTVAGTLTKQDAGTWTLSGANTYTGLTTVGAGILKLNNTAALGTTAGGTTVASGAVLDLNGLNYATAEPLTLSGTGIASSGALKNSNASAATFAGLITLGADAKIAANSGAMTLSNTGTITGAYTLTLSGSTGGTCASIIGVGAGGLVKDGSGTWTLTGASTYTGATNISLGTLKTGVASALPSASAMTVSGTLDLNGFNQSIGSLAGGGIVDNTSASAGTYTLSSGGDNTSTTFTGVIKNTLQTVALTKTGNGILTLSGTNTFTGATTVSGGTLLVNGADASSTVTVNTGAILGGTGSVGPIVGNSGTVQPGSSGSKGILGGTTANFSGGTSSKLVIRAAAFATAGTSYDRLNLSGALTLGGTSELDLDMTGIASAGTAAGIVLASSTSGTFDTVVSSNYTGVLGYNVVYNGTSIDLVVNNQAPSFTKGANQTVNENATAQTVANWASAINKGSTYESSQTGSFAVTNDKNGLFSVQPAISSAGALTYTPVASANGTATVTVRLHDNGGTTNGGVDSSAAQTFTITLTSINDAPSYTSGSNVTVLEDAGAYSGAWATSVSKGPANESSQNLTFTTTNSNNSLFSAQPAIASDGTLTFTPTANAFGTATVTVRLKDDGGTANGGVDSVAARTFTITVTSVNDAPSYTSGSNVTVLEDASAYSAAWASAFSAGPTNESSQNLTFTVTNDANTLFSVQPDIASDGTLTFTPAANANGAATVTVRLKDDGGTANGGVDSVAARTFTITVTSINDAPSYTSGSNITVLEDASAYGSAWASAIGTGPSNESGQTVAFMLTNDKNSLFSAQPAIASNGTLTFTLASNANGTATVTVRFKDNGGTVNGGVDSVAARTFTITATAVNDAPSFTKGSNQTLNQNAAAQTVAGWASAISSGPTDESGQTLSFAVTNDNSGLFSAQPAIASNGTLTYTLAANQNGFATVSVRIHDDGGVANGGVDSGALQSFTITVGAVNQAPSYTSGSDVTVLEDASAYSNAWATSLSKGPANEIAQALTFTLTNGRNSLFSVQPAIAPDGTLTFTPAANANGTATVTVRLKDDGGTANGGVDSVAARTFTITISSINDAPSYTSGSNVTVSENSTVYSAAWASAIGTGPLNESGQAVAFTVTNSDIALFGVQPAIASDGTLTFTPAASANGTATVTVRFKDDGGTANSGVDSVAARTFTITISSINDAPSYTSGSNVTVLEDASAYSTAWATSVSKGPANENAQALTFTVTNDANTMFSVQPVIAPDGTLTFTPAANANGTATVTVRLKDDGGTANGGVDSVGARTFTITVTSVNDAPSFTKGSNQTVNQNAAAQTVVGWASAISSGPTDESVQNLTFAVTNDNNGLFSAQPAIAANGTLTYTPASNQNGFATVSVRLHDNAGVANGGVDTSALQTFTITVSSVNQAPSYTSGSNVTVLEDASAYSAAWATSISKGPANENTQILTFTVTNDANTMFSVQPAIASDGTLTFTPAANANGTATVTVHLKDDGGTANGGVDSVGARTFTITVTSVNDAPSFTKGVNQTVNQNAAAQTVAGWASAISSGPTDESLQNLTFAVTNDNNGLFSAQPAIAANGTLTYTPASNQNGFATVSVRLHDNAGVANGGVDTSALQTFTITVSSVNQAPSYTSGSNVTVLEDASAYSNAWAASLSKGPANEIAQALTFTLTNDRNSLFSVQPAIAPDGTLTFTPSANANGAATVTVRLKDDGGTANGGVDSVAARTFTITATSVNDAPSFTKGSNQTVNQNAAAQTVAGWASAISSGPTDESGQVLIFAVTNDNNGLFSVQPAISSNGTLTYTLAANQSGFATVSVRIHDDGGVANGGVDSGALQSFTITVGAVNQAPSYTSGSDVTVLEDASAYGNAWATSLSKGPVNENGQALTFTVTNNANTMFIVQPAIASDGALTFTPAANANGTATVTVRLKDDGGTANGGVDSVAARTFTITLTAVNDAPSYTSGSDVTVLEDESAYSNVWASAVSTGPANEFGQSVAFTVTNSDNALFSAQPAIAPDGTLTFTPATNANGTATVTVRFKDDGGTANGGVDSLAARTFTITLTAVNDPPTFTDNGDVQVLQNSAAYSSAWASATSPGPSDESTQTVAFTVSNDNNPLFSVQPSVASDGTLTFTPGLNKNGLATVRVVLKDNGGVLNGGIDTLVRTFAIAIGSVNQAPSYIGGPDVTVLEDGTAYGSTWAAAIQPGPASDAGQNLAFTLTNNANALFGVQPSMAADGTLSFATVANANGTATVTVRLKDDGGTANGGIDSVAARTFLIHVTPVDDAPSFVAGADQSVLEDAGAQTVVAWATSISAGPANESGQILTFHVTNSDNALFSVQPAIGANGDLTYTPASNANGTATVSVRLHDNGGTSNGGVDTSTLQTFQIQVVAVNDAPTFVDGSPVSVLQNSGAHSSAWVTSVSTGPTDEVTQTLSFSVTNDNNTLFSAQPALAPDGTLTFTPAVDSNGTAIVSVRMHDNGGIAHAGVDSSTLHTFTITVGAVNQAPSYTSGSNVTVLEDAPAYSAAWATALSKGPANENGQTLTFTLTNDAIALFSAQPAIASDGTLTFTPAANAFGTANVTVRFKDDGGTANGGVDSVAGRTFTITLTSVNDAPTYTSASNVTVLENAAAQGSAWASAISAGPANELSQQMAFTVTNDDNALFSVQPAIASDGTLTFTPFANTHGAAIVTVRAKDDGGTASGGVDSVAARTFTITVSSVNQAPSYTSGSNITVLEDASAYSAAWAASVSKGPANEIGQALTFTVTNSDNTLFGTQPAIASDGMLTFTPAADAHGTATVTVRLKDDGGTANGGIDSVASRTFTITVTSVNDAPSYTSGANVAVLEDASAYSAAWATSVTAGPVNENGQALTFTVTNSDNTLFSTQPAIASDGKLTFTPATNAHGVATVTVRLKDDGGTADGGVDSVAARTFTITIASVNHAPSYTSGSNVTVLEDASAYSSAWATAVSTGTADESLQSLTFTTTNSDSSLFSAQPALASDGKLTFTPAADAHGTAVVTVRLKDDGGTANGGVDTVAARTFTITLTSVNDAPSYTSGSNVTVLEDASAYSAAWATALARGPVNENGQVLTFTVTNDANTLFGAQPSIASDGTLTFSPAANAHGAATVTVRLKDDGGTANGGVDSVAVRTFTITIDSVNDAPSFTDGAAVSVLQNSGAHSNAWATSVSAGAANEAGQVLTFTATNSDSALFSAQPALASNGTLSFTPAANANGAATVSVRLHDNGGTANGGVDSSTLHTFTITVGAVNQAPSFTKGSNQTVNEDVGAQTVAAWATSISAGPANESTQTLTFAVTNSNNGLFSAQPAIAADGTLTYTPTAETSGSATVTVRLHDNGGTANGGVDSSAAQTFTITVNLVNEAPTFTKGSDDTVLEDAGPRTVAGWATGIGKGSANESSQVLTFAVTNSNAALFSAQPAIAANGTLTYTPAANANGTATVTVRLHDNGGTAFGGVDSSAAQTFTIAVRAVNDAPTFTDGAAVSVLQNSGAYGNAWASSVSAGPIDEVGQALTFAATNDNASLFSAQPALAANGTLTFTPAVNASGFATVSVRLHDDGGTANGGADSGSLHTFTISVGAVNQAPTFTKGTDPTVNEDAGAQSLVGWASAISAGPANESSQTLVFAVTNTNSSLFSAQPAIGANGTLTFTPAANANGTSTVTVRLHDNGGTSNGGVDTSASQTFLITVTPVNDAPTFSKGTDQVVEENAGDQSVGAWANAIRAGPANEITQTLTFSVTNDNNALFSVQPAIAPDGTLTHTPAPSANGTATVTVRLHDNGGTANGGVDSSVAQTFTITVTSVNDAPSYTSGADVAVLEDASYSAAWATGLSNGPANESSQVLTFTTTNDNNGLFSTQPSIATNGTLTFTPTPNAHGTATVTVRLHDNGGTANGGVDSVAARTFAITVTPVNDAPTFTDGAVVSVLQNSGAYSNAWATSVSAGPADESSQTLAFAVTNSNSALFSAQPALAANGTLTFTPTANTNGSATVSVRLHDNGGTANGGVDSSSLHTFTITVGAVNQAPSFAKGADQTVDEDAGAQTVAAWASAISAGPANESTQVLTFAVTNSNSTLFSAQPAIAANGTLTFTPAANANGSANVTVRLHDNGGTANGGVDSSAALTFTITVASVDDAPSYTSGADVGVLEDASAYSSVWATGLSTGPANESSQILTFAVTNSNSALFSAQPAIAANGTLTFTPAANANGSATVTVRLHDDGGTANGGVDSVAARTFTITVTTVNDAPTFTDGAAVAVLENSGAHSSVWASAVSAGPADESIQTLTFAVTNSNAALFSAQPALAANGTLTFTPAANQNGSATVSVRLHDNGLTANGGVDSSILHTFTIMVGAVNQAPTFTKGSDLTVLEDAGAQTIAAWASGINAGSVGESSQTLSFATTNNNAALFSAAPAIAANGTLTYTPAANANGTATVTVRLHDNGGVANGGVDSTTAQTFTITVTAVNDAPSFVDGAAVAVIENSAAYSNAWASAISTGPADESSQTLTFATTNSNAALFSAQPTLAANGTLTFTPAANQNGIATVSVRLHDNGATSNGGVDSSTLHTFTITVGAVNQAPTFIKGADQTVLEDASAQTVPAWASAISAGSAGESSQTLTFAVTNSNSAIFSAAPAIAANGTLTYTPAANANGTATVSVRLHDNGGVANGGVDSSTAQTFSITVTSVNDAPTFVDGAAVTVLENSGAYSNSWPTSISAGPADESSQSLTFATTNSNAALFSAQPALAANGTLTFTPADNQNGSATVSVRLHDNGLTANGGVDSSTLHTFTITIGAVNQAPTFTKGTDQTVLEDAGAQTVAGWASGISAGPAGESSQTLTFATTNNNAALFSVAPAIAANGALTYTPAANANGTATVTVRLHDNGATANGGVDSSIAQTFAIAVTSVNDAPTFIDGAAVTVLENSGAYSNSWPTSISAGPADESSQTLTFSVTNSNAALFSAQPALAANGTLTFTPAANQNGSATVSVRLRDNGATANGGVDSSSLHTFTITIGAVNQAPTFTKGADQTVLEDAGAQTVPAWASAISAGPAGESSQTLTFATTSNNAALFSVAPTIAANGTLTYTPAANANGTATVTVRLHDNGATANGGVDSSIAQTFTIAITAVNDAPSFVNGLDLTTVEDGGAQKVAAWANSISAGPPDESGQKLTFVVSNSNNALFGVQPVLSADGMLEYTATPDAHGTATVSVRLKDDGATANGGVDSSSLHTFSITILSVNDAPSFTKGRDTSVDENSGAHTIAGWAASLRAGPPDEASQRIGFRVSTDNNALFATMPSIDSTGALTFASRTNTHGEAIVSVRMGDNGGTVNGGVDSSAVQTFKIVVRQVLLNLYPPAIVSDGGKADATDSVKENTQAVTTVRATDADSAAVLRYSIQGGVDASKFRVDSLTGALTFATAPDYETPSSSLGTNRYQVAVQVSDGLHRVSQNLTVEIVDVFEPTDPPVRLDLVPDTLRLLIGDTARPTLVVRAHTGGILAVDTSKLAWSWTPALGTLNSGLIGATKFGTSILKATLGTLSDSVVVFVSGVDSIVPPRKDTVSVKVGAGIKASVVPRDKPVVVDIKPQTAPLLDGMVVSTLAAQMVSQTDSVPMGLQIPVTARLAPTGRTSKQIEVFQIDTTGTLKRVAPVTVNGDSAKFATQGPGEYVLAWDTAAPKVAMRLSKDSLSSGGSTVPIQFSITDNTPDARTRICWRAAGAADGICRDIHSGNTDSGVAELKKSDIPLGADVWVEARDQTYSTSSVHKDVLVHIDTLKRSDALPEDRYDLLSMPYFDSSKYAEVELERVYGTYDIHRWRAYRTTPEGFVEVKNTDTREGPGTAWWVRTRKALSSPWYSDAWTTPTSKPVEVRLAPGWTAVGSPYSFDVDWKTVMDSSKLNALQVSGPYAFAPESQSWSLPDTTRRLKAWHGVLVRNNTDSTLVLKFPSLSWQALGSRAMAFAPRSQRFDLIASQAGYDSARISAGIDSSASNGLDALDHPLPPTPGRQFTMAFPTTLAGGRTLDFLTDVRPVSDSATRWTFQVGGLKSGTPLVLRSFASAGSGGTPIWLVDQKSQAVVDWTNSVEFAVGDEAERSFTLVVGGKRPAAPSLTKFGIECGRYDVRWQVPSSMGRTQVRVELLDLRGRRVRTLVDEQQDPGEYSTFLTNHGLSKMPLIAIIEAGGRRASVTYLPLLAK